ncbi:MAG: hypothetical protein KF709_06430 [Gemmatimonadaceae bacterium]|nr:hypothetical protein [Gemmatimonadaceae bacterium]
MSGFKADRSSALRNPLRWLWRGMALLLALSVLVPRLAWEFTAPVPLRVLVVDKTVPQASFGEHDRVAFWLTHRRVPTADGRKVWDVARDYLGYDPIARRGEAISAERLAGVDLVYLADAYGVYTGDSAEVVAHSTRLAALERSTLVYGGLSLPEVELLESHVARGGSLVAEFNTLEQPTAGSPAGERMGALLGARYDRWLMRWYADLASEDEIPSWMRERWERLRGRRWPHRGPGIVVFHETDERIVVIDSTEFTSRWPVTLEVERPDDPLVRRVRSGQPYWYWISAVSPLEGAEVLATFRLHVTPAAEARLRRTGFSPSVPAVVRRAGVPLVAYVTGDIADVGVEPPPLMRTRYMDWYGRWQAREGRPGPQRRFFWRSTLPLWDGMLDEVRALRSRPD